jgi:hypothetical protein
MPTTTKDFDAEALYAALLAEVRAGLAGVPDAPSSASIRAAPGWPSGWPPTSA